MTKQEAVKTYKKKRNAYRIASYLLMFLTLLFYIIYAAVTKTPSSDPAIQANQILAEQLIKKLIAIGIIGAGLFIACVFISNKLRTTVWMVNTIIGTLLLGKWALIITFALWLVDEYFLKYKAEKYKSRVETVKVMLDVE